MSYLHQAHSKHWQLANQNKCQTIATTEPATIADTTHTFPPKSSSPMKPMEAATVVQAIPRKPSFLHASVLVPRQHEQPQPLGGGLRRQPIQLHERLNQLAEAVLARVHIGRVAVFRTEQGNQPMLACGNVIVLLGLICAAMRFPRFDIDDGLARARFITHPVRPPAHLSKPLSDILNLRVARKAG